MTVSILGCGWYGKALASALLFKGFLVKGSVTDIEKKEQLSLAGILPYQISIDRDDELIENDFFVADVLILGITPKFRQGQGNAYLYKLEHIIDAIHRNKVKHIIYISSTGVYADDNRYVNELNVPEPVDENGKILFNAENLFKDNINFKTTILRFGGLIGPGRDPGRFFAGRVNIPNGRAPVNLIHLDDCVGVTLEVINQECFSGVFNAVMPYHPDKNTFYSAASLRSGLPGPLFRDELKGWKIVESINLTSILNYQFKFAGADVINVTAGYNI